ncbi:MAG: NAD(P)/FAD-dependent oxidoreductase, partial [candidate division Zixibacteria bacterium]|nr:NAD(P)/FAD-dependent oxidoreductase [candidate division Zixibacteria bacterium]
MEIQREELEVDILIVGAGPAGLACGYHLAKQWNKENGELPEVVIIEKSPTVGMHLLSGAVLDPRPMAEMMPDFLEQGMPVEAKTGKESFLFLTEKGQLKSPLVPPGMHNKGNYIISLYKFAIWLAEKVEELGVNIFTGTGGAELLIEDGRVVGVQTVDMGREKDGSPADNFEPGSLIKAKVTVLSEGVRGSLTEQAYEKLGIGEGKLPHSFLTGIKEIWKVPAGRMKDGEVVHTFG